MQPEKTAGAGTYLTASELSQLFGVSPKTVYAWGKQKKIPFQKSHGGVFKFSFDHVKKLWENRFSEGLIDRRRGGGQRFMASYPVRLLVGEGSVQHLEAETIDLSPGGMRLKVRHPSPLQNHISEGQPVRLEVQGFDGPLFRTPLRGYLRRYENLSDGAMAVGLELDRAEQPEPPPLERTGTTTAAGCASYEDCVTAAELSQQLGINLRTLFAWVKQGRLAYQKSPGGIFTFPRSHVDRLLAEKDTPDEEIERRREQRLEMRLPVQLSVVGAERFTYDAVTTNLCSGGLRLLMKSPYFIKYEMQKGKTFDVVLKGLPPPLFRETLHGALSRFEVLDRGFVGVGVELYDM